MAGVSYAAVLPPGLALLYETGEPQARARRVAWYGVAALGGFLLGPALGGGLAGLAEGAAALPAHRVVQLALGAQASAAALAVVAVYFGTAPSAIPSGEPPRETGPVHDALAPLLAAMLVAFMPGGFEIAATLQMRGPLGFDSRAVAGLFIACSAAMAVSQLVFLPRVPPRASRVAWALAIVAASAVMLAVMPFAASYAGTLALGGLIGGGLGLAFGLLGLQTAASAGARRGLALGAQNAAMNAGQAAGSILGGAIFATMGGRALPAFGAAVILLTLLMIAIRSARRRLEGDRT